MSERMDFASFSKVSVSNLALLALLLLGLSQPVSAGTLYRYINEKGYQEIGYSIPTHLVANGYDVIDESGRLVRRVAPQLSEEEYAAKLEREKKLEACEKALARVNRRYENLADIDEAEQLFEQKLDESLSNLQANLEHSKTTLITQQASAANLERSGKVIPKQMLNSIQQTEAQIQAFTAKIELEERSRFEKADSFDAERRIFMQGNCTEEQLASAR